MKATNIKWDIDIDENENVEDVLKDLNLPTEIEIPEGLTDDGISDYLSDVTGYCHYGYELVSDNDKELEKLWEELEDVLFIENENKTLVLASEWNGFEAGTDRETIWYWFDARHSKGVGWLLNEYEFNERLVGDMAKTFIITLEVFDETTENKIESIIDNTLNNNGINCTYDVAVKQ